MYVLWHAFYTVAKISNSDLEIGDEMGSGATGAVYKGQWLSRNKKVAIKRVVGKINRREVCAGCSSLLYTFGFRY